MPSQTHTVTIAQALAGSTNGLLVLDTAANIASALPNAGLVSRVTSFTVTATAGSPAVLTVPQMLLLSGLGASLHAQASSLKLNSAATVTVAQLVALEALPGFTMGSAANLTLSDTTANIVSLLASHPAYFSQVSAVSVHLDGTTIGAYPATQLNGLTVHGKTLTFVSSPGFTTLNIAAAAHDLGSNAAALNQLGSRQALTFALTNEGATMTAADAAGLATLNGFHIGMHALSVSDTAANIAANASHIFGQGFTGIQVSSGTLSGNASELLDPSLHFSAGAHAMLIISAIANGASAAALAALPGFSLANGVTVSIADTAAHLATLQPSVIALAAAEELTAPATVSAATAATLAGLAHLNLGGNALTVSDTLPALLGMSAQAQGLASSLVLSANATASVAQITAFASVPHASLGSSTIAVSDRASNLLNLSGVALADASSLTLSQDATLNAANFAALGALPAISAGGHNVSVVDTAANLATLSGNLSMASAIQLSSSATVNAAQIAFLAALPNFSLAGNTLSVTDTAAHLLTLSASVLALAGSVTLSADATVSAAQAESLLAEPGFSTGGHMLVVADTAANLLALPSGSQLAATTLVLSGSQTVSAATLTQLAGLGIKFSEAGHSLTCADTAANLATLQPSAAALASAELITAPATVSAGTAATLAGFAHLGLCSGATLTIQDSVNSLIALGSAEPALTSKVQLAPGSAVMITAAQGAALAAISHFSSSGSSIVVADSVAHLTSPATVGWQSVATSTDVCDTAAALAAASGTTLVQSADNVTLSANGQVNAAAAARIAAIPHFSSGSFGLTVVDTAAATAAHAAAVLQVATAAVVTDSGPIGVAGADQLATISQAGLLTFQGGDQLTVQDSLAALTDPVNSAGVSLAARIDVLDTAANLVAASTHDWGGVNPNYLLSQPATITASQATALAGLGSHFSAGTNTLSVNDSAANVIGAASALFALHVEATVSDSAADLGAAESSLLALGTTLAEVYVIDGSGITASVAAGLSVLAPKLGTQVLAVADSALNVDASLSGLMALGSHITVAVTDTAANVATTAADLAALQSPLSVQLTDTLPVSAAVATALTPIAANLTANTSLAVSDTGAALASNSTALFNLGSHLGAITLSDGATQTAAVSASLALLDEHMASSLMLTATGSGTEVTAHIGGLEQLASDHHLASVVVSSTSVADAVNNTAALNALPSDVSISDSAANVDGSLSALEGITGLNAITLTDPGTPTLTMNIATLEADATVLDKINSPYTIVVSDTAADIAADLGAGAASAIAGHLAQIGTIEASDSNPVVLTQTQILAPGVDDGPGSALSKFSGVVDVTGVDVAHLAQIAGLVHAPAEIAVADTAACISADLAQGNGSLLLNILGTLSAIATTDYAPITLTASQLLTPGIDDSAGSAIGLLNGTTLLVTGATVAQLTALGNLHVLPAAISVSDSAANLSADLASGNSLLVAGLPVISAISVQDGMTITLSEQQLLAPHVDDGSGSVLSEVTGGSLAATGVLASDLALMLGLGVAPNSISIADTAAHIVSNLASIETDIADVGSIAITAGTLMLSAGEALAEHVDDGLGSLIDRLAGHTFQVSGASVMQVGQLAGLPDAPTSIAVSDSAADLVTDLLSGHSILAANSPLIGTISVAHNALMLTDSQAEEILQTPALDALMAKLAPATTVLVTGVPVADVAGIAGSGWPHIGIAVSDSPAEVASDLEAATPSLTQNSASILSVTLNQGGTVSAEALTLMASLPHFSNGGFSLSVQDSAAAIAGLGAAPLGFVTSVGVLDTDTNIAGQLDTLQQKFNGHLSIVITNGAPSVVVSASTYSLDTPTIDAITNQGAVSVSGSASALAAMAAKLSNDDVVGHVLVTDSAADVISDLSALQSMGAKLGVILSDTSLSAALVAPLLTIGNFSPLNIPVMDTGAQIAALIESGSPSVIAYLQANGSSLSGDSAVNARDAEALESLPGFQKGPFLLEVWDTAAHLASSTYASALTSPLVDSVHLKTSDGLATVSASVAATLFGIANFSTSNPDGSTNILAVSDSAAHIDANLATLTNNISSIESVTVNAPGSVTAQVLTDLWGMNATEAPGVNLTISDTASNIATLAATAVSSNSIQPGGWIMSENGTVSEAQAVLLGNLANFSAGGHTITIALNGDLTISSSDAGSLGNIGTALDLNGHHLFVDGNVAQLSALSTAALAVVTPVLVDNFANVASLPANSPLLHGTVEITGSAPVTASQASALLGMVDHAISSGALTIDQPHMVVDTVANLRQFESASAWTSNPAVQSSFELSAQDAISNLVNPASTSFLTEMAQTTLQGDATVSASTAASLATIAAAIHFTPGTESITVSDSAANLLDPSNASGLTLATNVSLTGGSPVDTADAEQLLGIHNLSITGPLSIVDNSENLLDGHLSGVISGSHILGDITVQLAGPETLDADTAETLVSIPGFDDAANLTIADSSSYLLNTANLPAELVAHSVTLAGDEAVSASTILRLSEIPHFTSGTAHLILAGDDFADSATLKAIADEGASFQPGGHSVTLTQDVLDLTPAEYMSLQSDNIIGNGHALGVLPENAVATEDGNLLDVTWQGVAGSAVDVYAADGSLLSSSTAPQAEFTAQISGAGSGQNLSLTEVTGGVQGAPIVILDAAMIEGDVANAGETFASSGSIQVDPGKFINLYQSGSVPVLSHAALVYDPSAHTVSLDVPNSNPVTLITLGGATPPSNLDLAEIVFKHHI